MGAEMRHWIQHAKHNPFRLASWGAWLGLAGLLAAKADQRGGLGIWWKADKGKLPALVESCWWWGGLAVGLLGLVLLLTSRWWARSWPAVAPDPPAPVPRWLVPAVLVLMLAGTAVRVPRLGLSLYNDESHVFRAHLAGEVPKAHLGNPEKYRPVTWISTLYENRAGNNAMPFSILSRLSYDTWRKFTGAPSGRVNEPALRLPILVCGVLSIGAMAWLGFRLGGPGLALLAALMTAFHPWHMRYSVEARGYALLMLALPLAFVALHSALRAGRWWPWLRFGLLQYLVIACWFGAAHLVAALYLTLLVYAVGPALGSRRQTGEPFPVRWNLLIPFTLAGVLSLALYLQFNLPHFVQLSKALADPGFFKSPDPFPLSWFQDVAGFLGFGIPGLPVESGPAAPPSVTGYLAGRQAAVFGLAILLWVAGLVAGGVRLAGPQRPAGLALAGGTLGGALLTYLYCSAKGIVFLKWYPLFLLPGLLLLLGAGLLRLGRNRIWTGLLLTVPLLAAWTPGLLHYAHHGRENLRGAVELARGVPYPTSLGNPNQTLYATTWSESPVYDPAAVTLKDAGMLQALMTRATGEGRPLFVAYGHRPEAQAYAGDILKVLDDPARFRPIARLPGLDETGYDHYVLEFLPPPAGGSLPAGQTVEGKGR